VGTGLVYCAQNRPAPASELQRLWLYLSTPFIDCLLKACGIRIETVTEAMEHFMQDFSRQLTDLYPFLRTLKACREGLTSELYHTGESLEEAFCRTLAENRFSNTVLPEDVRFADVKESLKGLDQIWTDQMDATAL
jgi:hypothetical protein